MEDKGYFYQFDGCIVHFNFIAGDTAAGKVVEITCQSCADEHKVHLGLVDDWEISSGEKIEYWDLDPRLLQI